VTAAVLNLRTDVEVPHRNEIFRKMGSFWQEKFEDREVVKTLVGAMQDQFNAADITLKEAIATQTSVAQAPLYHTELWYRVFIRQADLTEEHPNTPFYSEENGFYGSGMVYGQGVPTLWTWSVPQSLVNPNCAANAIENPTWVGYVNQAFFYYKGLLGFRLNPFLDPRFTVIETEQGPGIEIWLYCSEWDTKTIGKQYGGPLGIPMLSSTESYRKLCEGAWEARIRGPSDSSLYKVIAGASGVPLCETDGEIVEAITTAPNGDHVVVTDKLAYRFPKSHLVTVTIGQVLAEGQELTDALKVRHPASMRSGDDDITVPPGFFNQDARAQESIRFPNRRVPVIPGGLDAGGNREISFELHGQGADLKKYRRATTAAQIYKLFDTRGPQAVSVPTAAQIKADVNPAIDLVAKHTKPHLILLYGDPAKWPAPAEQQALLFSQADKIIPAHGRLVMQPRTSSESVSSQSYTSSSSSTKSRSESTWSSRSTNSSSSPSSSRSSRSTLSTDSSEVSTSSISTRSLSTYGTASSSSLSTSSVSSQSPSSRSSRSVLSASSVSLSSRSTASSDTTSVTQSTQTDASSRSTASTSSSSSTFFRFSTSSLSETFSSESTLAAWSTSSRSSTSTAALNSTSSLSTNSSSNSSSSPSSNSSSSPSSNTSSSKTTASLSTRSSVSVSTVSSRSESSFSISRVSSSSRSSVSESSRTSKTDSSNSLSSQSTVSLSTTTSKSSVSERTVYPPESPSSPSSNSSSSTNGATKCGDPLPYRAWNSSTWAVNGGFYDATSNYSWLVKRLRNYGTDPLTVYLYFKDSYTSTIYVHVSGTNYCGSLSSVVPLVVARGALYNGYGGYIYYETRVLAPGEQIYVYQRSYYTGDYTYYGGFITWSAALERSSSSSRLRYSTSSRSTQSASSRSGPPYGSRSATSHSPSSLSSRSTRSTDSSDPSSKSTYAQRSTSSVSSPVSRSSDSSLSPI